MKCYNCGQLLPEDSEFCQYCGTKIEQVGNVASKKTIIGRKKIFCSFCGSTINQETRKCSGCGKQYFKGIKIKPLLNCIFCVILFVSLCFNIMQHIRYVDLIEKKCAIPGCNRIPQKNSFYCFSHECADVVCHEQRANAYSSYCANHKCAETDCNSSRAIDSTNCYRHR